MYLVLIHGIIISYGKIAYGKNTIKVVMVIYFTALMVNNQRNINLTLVTWKSFSDSKAFFYDNTLLPVINIFFFHFYNDVQDFCLDHIFLQKAKDTYHFFFEVLKSEPTFREADIEFHCSAYLWSLNCYKVCRRYNICTLRQNSNFLSQNSIRSRICPSSKKSCFKWIIDQMN